MKSLLYILVKDGLIIIVFQTLRSLSTLSISILMLESAHKDLYKAIYKVARGELKKLKK